MDGGRMVLVLAYLGLIRRYVDNIESMLQGGRCLTAEQVAALLVDDAKRLQELIDETK